MENIPIQCPQCGGNIKYIPAGVSKKTNKPYGEFWACSHQCGYTWRKPKENTVALPVDKMVDIMNALKVINDNIKLLHQKFDAYLRRDNHS